MPRAGGQLHQPDLMVRATSLGSTAELTRGQQADLGVVHVRSVRDVDVFGPCAACASCGSLQASWVAWVRH